MTENQKAQPISRDQEDSKDGARPTTGDNPVEVPGQLNHSTSGNRTISLIRQESEAPAKLAIAPSPRQKAHEQVQALSTDYASGPVNKEMMSSRSVLETDACSQSNLFSTASSPTASMESDTATVSSSSSLDQHFPEETQAARKGELVDRLMSEFFQLFSFKQCGTGRSRTSATSQSQPSQNRTNALQHRRKRHLNGHQGISNNNDSGGSDDGDEVPGGKRRNLEASESVEIKQRRLACPYFKRDRAKYAVWRSCPGPGWTSVHRLK